MDDNPLNLIKRMYRAVEMGGTPSETARARGRRTLVLPKLVFIVLIVLALVGITVFSVLLTPFTMVFFFSFLCVHYSPPSSSKIRSLTSFKID